MGYLWDGTAMICGGGNINAKLSRSMNGFLIAALFVLAILAASPASAADSGANGAESYCVKMGYLYRTMPVPGGVEERCVFPDRSYCEAKAFFDGTCGRTLFPSSDSYVYSGDIDWSSQARTRCFDSNGRLREVHTPYGDVVMCALPDGSICDLRQLLAGMCGDDWLAYAYDWLHAP